MINDLAKLAGVVILAGGASRRMGTPKAELTLPNNERLLDYHVRQAFELQVPIMIADNGRGFNLDADLMKNDASALVSHIKDYQASHYPSRNDQSSDYKRPDTDNGNSNGKDDGDIKTGGALVAIESALQILIKPTPSLLSPMASSWLLVISCDSLIPAPLLWQKLSSHIDIVTDRAANKKVICLSDGQHLYPLLGLYHLSVESELNAYLHSGARKVMSLITPMTQALIIEPEWQRLTNFNTPSDFKRACTAWTDLQLGTNNSIKEDHH